MSTLVTATVKSNSSSPVAFQNSSGTEIGTLCRAWVNFNGTSTVAIRAQFNVSSITDNGTGDYTVNFTTAMVDTNYTVNASNNFNSVAPTQPGSWSILVAFGSGSSPLSQAPISSGFRIISVSANDFVGSRNDCGHVMLSVFR